MFSFLEIDPCIHYIGIVCVLGSWSTSATSLWVFFYFKNMVFKEVFEGLVCSYKEENKVCCFEGFVATKSVDHHLLQCFVVKQM